MGLSSSSSTRRNSPDKGTVRAHQLLVNGNRKLTS
jgi:hypothetical protein